MRSDAVTVFGREFDVLVVGGGIQGAAIARESALRGARTLLVDADDFANGTSMRSSRLIHGGVRYLQQGHIALVREALAERERLLRAAPHLVRPLPMLMPFFRDGGGKPPWMVRMGLRMYSWLARGSTMPGPRWHDASECARLFPGIRTRDLRGGSLFFDARTEDLLLTLAVLTAAHEAGAVLCNHTEVVGGDAAGLELVDRICGDSGRVRAKHVVNAAGPAVDVVRDRLGLEGEPCVRLSRGSHLVLDAREGETAIGAFLPDGRIQFVIPHRDGTLCGTTEYETDEFVGPPPRQDVDYLLDALRFLMDPAPGESDVRFAYAGWRALPARSGPAGGINREAFVVDEALADDCTVHTVVGGKLTTHRSFAERTIARMFDRNDASPSRDQALPGGDGPQEPGDPLWWRHGSRAARVRALIASEPALAERVAADRDHLHAEAVYALREQGAVTFTDLMLRRLFHTCGPDLDEQSLRAMHELYVRERPVEIDRTFEQDRDLLLAELERMHGSVGALERAR